MADASQAGNGQDIASRRANGFLLWTFPGSGSSSIFGLVRMNLVVKSEQKTPKNPSSPCSTLNVAM